MTIRFVTTGDDLTVPAATVVPALETHITSFLSGMAYQVAGDTAGAGYVFDQVAAAREEPVKISALVAADGVSGSRQRMPAVEKLSDGTLLMSWSQIHNAESVDGYGARLVYALITYDLTAGTISAGAPIVLDEPPNWVDMLGFAGHPAIIKLPADATTHPGRVIVVYNYNDAASGSNTDRILNIYETHSDDDGATWSAKVKIHDAPGETAPRIAAMGSAGSFVRIPSGANAGRLVFPVWIALHGPLYCVYSDDDGATWTKGNELAAIPGSGINEWSIAWRPDGVLIASVRNDVSTDSVFKKDIYMTSVDGGATWVYGGFKDDWLTKNCPRAQVQAAPVPADGFPKVLWSGLNGEGNLYTRSGLVLRVSHDGGMSYQVEYAPVPAATAAGYSDVKMIGKDVFAVAWESGFNAYCDLNVYIANMAEVYTNGTAHS